jgi:hypothetical protein
LNKLRNDIKHERNLNRRNREGKRLKRSVRVPRRSRGIAAVEQVLLPPVRPTWSHDEFTVELHKAENIGPRKLGNTALLDFCRGAHGYFNAHFLIDARPIFVELWRRIKEGIIPETPTKRAACLAIGCTLRWAEAIVAGTATDSNRRKAKRKRTKCEFTSHPPANWTNEHYVLRIAEYALTMLEPLSAQVKSNVCKDLERTFEQASQIPFVSDASAVAISAEEVV